MYDKTKTFVNTVQRNCNVEVENVSDSNFISKNYGCICTCCHGNNFQRCECVIFLQRNYNLLIPSVAKALSKRCKAIKSKEFICKKCHASLKMGKILGIIILKSGGLAHVRDNDVIVCGDRDKNVKHNVENVQVSMDLMQNPTITDRCMCTCCHVTDIPHNNCIIFEELRYDLDNDNVWEALDCRFLVSTSKEFICNKCGCVLLKNMMPDNAVNSPTKKLVDSQNKMCLMCKNNVIEFHLFKQTAYGNNPSVTKLLRDVPRHSHHVVCKTCHTTLWDNCIIECVSCGNNTFRKSMIVFHQERYDNGVHSTFANGKCDGKKMYICKGCDRNVQEKFVCVCHVGEKLQRKCVKFIKKMNMTSNNLLFSNVLVGAFLKLTVHMFVCHVTLHLQQLTLKTCCPVSYKGRKSKGWFKFFEDTEWKTRICVYMLPPIIILQNC